MSNYEVQFIFAFFPICVALLGYLCPSVFIERQVVFVFVKYIYRIHRPEKQNCMYPTLVFTCFPSQFPSLFFHVYRFHNERPTFFLVANRQCITVVSRLVVRKEGKHLGSACEKIATKSDEILFNTVSFHNHSYFQPVVTLFLVTC